MDPKIVVKGIHMEYYPLQGKLTALEGIDLEVYRGEFLCILGPSGCGKSTFLRLVAGLLKPSSGEIAVLRDGQSPFLATLVFQEYALFPWRSVLDNVAFGLEMHGQSKAKRYEVAQHFIEKVGLREFSHAFPHQLSGGMKQRVGIARAFASDPEILLMDEPFGALDAQTRTILQDELIQIWEESRKTVIYVTHSIDESIYLGDRIVLMTSRPGKVKEIFAVDLPRPRKIEMKGWPLYSELSLKIWGSLKEEVERSSLGDG